MMQLYRARLRPLSPVSTQLQSDALFGAFCWSFRYRYGADALEQLLAEMEQGAPGVTFSNAFPTGTLPLPLGIRDTQADFERIVAKAERKKAYQNHKKLKNARYLQCSFFEKAAAGDCAGFTAGLSADGITEQTSMHNMVSRNSGTVQNLDGSGNLYGDDELFLDCQYDIYILSGLPGETLRKTVELMLMLGLGKNKSTSKGAFELDSWEELPPFEAKKGDNAFMALSNFIPARNDPAKGHYKTLVKYGKLDREFAASEQPFKKPLLYIQAGAVFYTDDFHPCYGRIVKNVSTRSGVVVNGRTIAVPIQCGEGA